MNILKINFFIILFFSTTNFAMLKNSTQEEIFLSNLAEHVKEGKSFFDELPVLVLEEIAKYITIFDNQDRFFLKRKNILTAKKIPLNYINHPDKVDFINVLFTENNSLICIEHKMHYLGYPGHIKLSYWQLNKTLKKENNKTGYFQYIQTCYYPNSYFLSENNKLFITNAYGGTKYTLKDKIHEKHLYSNDPSDRESLAAHQKWINKINKMRAEKKEPRIKESKKLKKQIKKLLEMKYPYKIRRYKNNNQLNFEELQTQGKSEISDIIIYKILDKEKNKVIIISSKSIDIWDTTFFNNPSLENFLKELKEPQSNNFNSCVIS